MIVGKFPATVKTNVEVKATQSAIPSAMEGGVFDELRSFPRLALAADVWFILPVYVTTRLILTTKESTVVPDRKRPSVKILQMSRFPLVFRECQARQSAAFI